MIYSRPPKTTSIVTMAHCLDKEDWKRESSWKVEHDEMRKQWLEDRLVAISKDQQDYSEIRVGRLESWLSAMTCESKQDETDPEVVQDIWRLETFPK